MGFTLDGRIDDTGYSQTVTAIKDALTGNDKIRIYAEVESIGAMSFDTFIENIKFKFDLFKNELNKFEKEAVVSDKEWLEPLLKLGDKIFPSIEVKYYSLDKRDEALAWVKNQEAHFATEHLVSFIFLEAVVEPSCPTYRISLT